MTKSFRSWTYETLEEGGHARGWPRLINLALMILVVLNVLAVIMETVEPLYSAYGPLFEGFNTFSIGIFTIEYILRIWSCIEDPRYRAPKGSRLRFAITPLAIVDLLVVLPFYLPFIFDDLRFIRAMRLFRFFRILKLARYSRALQTFDDVLRLKKDELGLMLFTMIILLITSAGLMYEVEHAAQPEAFASIPDAMWWGIVTLATVGYSDIYPVTPWGRLIGSLVVILGIGLFALPAGILAMGFVEVQAKRREEENAAGLVCPYCGRLIGKTAGYGKEQDEEEGRIQMGRWQ